MINRERIRFFIEGLRIFGYRFVQEVSYLEAFSNEVERLKLTNKLGEVVIDRKRLEHEVEVLKEDRVVIPLPIDIADPTPTKAGERKTYVAEVAGFHKKILHKKLMSMIHAVHIMLEEEANSVGQDRMLKGATYAFRELDHWGDLMISESVGNSSNNVSTEDGAELEK